MPLCGYSPLPITRTGCNDFFPRISAKRRECCRPSTVANRSTFPPRLFLRSLHVSEAGRQFFSDQRRAQPGKNTFPSRRFAGMKIHSHEKHKNARKAVLALPLLVATPARRRRPGHSSSLAFLASLAWDDFTQRAQSPRREVLGAALFCKRVLTAEGQRSTIQLCCSYGSVHKQGLRFTRSECVVPLWVYVGFQDPELL